MNNRVIFTHSWFTPRRVWIAAALTLVLILGTVLVRRTRETPDPGTPAVTTPGDYDPVALDAWAEVKYDRLTDLGVDFPAAVRTVHVKAGDLVTQGQPLVTLDLAEYDGRRRQLEQQLAAAQASLPALTQAAAALQAAVTQTEADLSRKTAELRDGTSADLALLQSALAFARQEVTWAEADLADAAALLEVEAIARRDYERYEQALAGKRQAAATLDQQLTKARRGLQTELEQLTLALASQRAELSATRADRTGRESQIAALEVDLALLQAKAGRAGLSGEALLAPYPRGIVANVRVSSGSRLGVQNTPTPVLQLIDLDSLYLEAEVEEEFVGRVTPGQAVRILPEAWPDRTFDGTVRQISALAVEKDGRRIVLVQVTADDPEGWLRPGFTASVLFPPAEVE